MYFLWITAKNLDAFIGNVLANVVLPIYSCPYILSDPKAHIPSRPSQLDFKMSLYEVYQPSMLHFENFNLFSMDDHAGEYTYSPPFSLPDGSPDISSSMQYLEAILSDEYMEFPVHVDDVSLIHDFQMDIDEFDSIFDIGAIDMPKPVDETEDSGESCCLSQLSSKDGSHECNPDHAMKVSCETSSIESTLVLPFEGMEVDSHLSLVHLLMAYAEAVDNQETELSEMIAQCILQKVNPVGGTTERVLYYMFKHLNNQPDYLTQESTKNFYPAFKVFYQMFPYGKFAHFVVNLAILESLPEDAEIIYLIDFDIGEGIQWASLVEALKHQHKEIRLISVKSSEEDQTSPLTWRFEETKRRLCDHAGSHGLIMKVEEVGLEDLETVMKNIKQGDYQTRSWYAFNCNVGLPHMGRIRSRKDVREFLRVVKNFLHNTSKGIMTYGDGDAWPNMTSSMSYTSFLDGNFLHYQALLESMEFSFPRHLGEARTALECLFVAPYVSSVGWDRKLEEVKQCGGLEFAVDLEGWTLSEASLGEAREVVQEGVSPYGARIEGEKKNEMVMTWNGIPIVRVCCWQSCHQTC